MVTMKISRNLETDVKVKVNDTFIKEVDHLLILEMR
jgi:hypothetical protein